MFKRCCYSNKKIYIYIGTKDKKMEISDMNEW